LSQLPGKNSLGVHVYYKGFKLVVERVGKGEWEEKGAKSFNG